VTVSAAVRLTPPDVEEIVTTVADVTTFVETTEPDTLVAPAGTVTVASTVATAVLLLDSVTTVPPAGALERDADDFESRWSGPR
jgi:hypothetical protein